MIIPSFLFSGAFSGIYCLRNKVNNKKYVGSSKNMYSRLHKHRCLLKKNKHENHYLQNAINKYSLDSFEVSILEFVKVGELLTKEQFYVDYLQPEYNIIKKVIRNTPTRESIEKAKATRKLRQQQGLYGCPSCNKIYEHDLEGNVIRDYKSLNEAASVLKIHVCSIISVLKGKYKQVKGKRFSYSGEKLEYFEKSINGKAHTSLGKSVTIKDTFTNDIHLFSSYEKAAKFMNVKPTCINYFFKKQTLCKKRFQILSK